MISSRRRPRPGGRAPRSDQGSGGERGCALGSSQTRFRDPPRPPPKGRPRLRETESAPIGTSGPPQQHRRIGGGPASSLEPSMVRVVASSRVGAAVMHMLGTPKTMQAHPPYDEVLGEGGPLLSELLRTI